MQGQRDQMQGIHGKFLPIQTSLLQQVIRRWSLTFFTTIVKALGDHLLSLVCQR